MSQVVNRTTANDDELNDRINVEGILANFFLKQIEMGSSRSDDDREYRRRSKHKKHKSKKSKRRHRDSSSSSERNYKHKLETSSSEEKDIKRLKKIKSEAKESNKVSPVNPVSLATPVLESTSPNVALSTEENLTYGPSLELLLGGTGTNDSELEKNVEPAPDVQAEEKCEDSVPYEMADPVPVENSEYVEQAESLKSPNAPVVSENVVAEEGLEKPEIENTASVDENSIDGDMPHIVPAVHVRSNSVDSKTDIADRDIQKDDKAKSSVKRKSRSRSKSRTRSRKATRSRSRSKSKARKKKKSRSRSRSKSKARNRRKSRSRSRSKSKTRIRKKSRSRSKSKTRNRRRSLSRSRTKSPPRRRRRSRTRSTSKSRNRRRRRSRTRSRSRSRIRNRGARSRRTRTRSRSRILRRSRSRSRSRSRIRNRRRLRSRSRSKSRNRRRPTRSRSKSRGRRQQTRSRSKSRGRKQQSRSRSKSRGRRQQTRSRSKSGTRRRRRSRSGSRSKPRRRSRSRSGSKPQSRKASRSRSASKTRHRSRSKSQPNNVKASEGATSRSRSRSRKSSKQRNSKSRSPSKSKKSSRSRSRSRETKKKNRQSRSRSLSMDKKGRSRSGSPNSKSKESSHANKSENSRESSPKNKSHSKRRSRSKSKERESSSKSRKIDQAKIREIAHKNVLNMIEQGTLPEGLSVDIFKKEQAPPAKPNEKSVQELTDFCVKLSKKENDPIEESSPAKETSNKDSDAGFIHHPFKLKEPSTIKLNIKNAIQIPVKTHAEKFAETKQLSSQFPVSSGNQHKQKELEWVPVEPKESKDSPKAAEAKPATASPATALPSTETHSPQLDSVVEVSSPSVTQDGVATAIPLPVSPVPPLPPPPPMPIIKPLLPPPLPPSLPSSFVAASSQSMGMGVTQAVDPAAAYVGYEAYPAVGYPVQGATQMSVPTHSQAGAYSNNSQPSSGKQKKLFDITSIVSKRFKAVTKLQQDPNDVEALKAIEEAQANIQEWVQSQSVPGLFTGSTNAKMLSVEELCGPRHWSQRVKKDIFTRAAPVTGGKGMSLLKKMGWNPGEGLGKNKEGTLEPLVLDIKTDKKGLVSTGEGMKRSIANATKELQGKHPVSALMELCSKRKWKPPMYTCIKDTGPPHKKIFLFKVEVNGVEYQPATPSSNKKVAKADSAVVCLQALNVFSK